jgi:hypothetical protein
VRQPDVERLRAAHPQWAIEAVWTAASSGPDYRALVAERAGVTVYAATAAELTQRIGVAESHERALAEALPLVRERVRAQTRASARPDPERQARLNALLTSIALRRARDARRDGDHDDTR